MSGGGVLGASFLGGFSLTYGNAQLDVMKTSNSQFASLLQLVLHYPDGARLQDLQDALFGGRRGSVEDVPHAIRSVVYNANRRLEMAGVPGRPNIIQKKGSCRWSGSVEVRDDSRVFEALAGKALESRSVDDLEAACYAYAGEFLAGYANSVWIVSEARRYRALFTDCASAACGALRHGDQDRLFALAAHAACVCPFAGWEQVSVQALNAMGRRSEAMDLYVSTSRKYFQEQGIRLRPWQALPGPENAEWHWAGKPLQDVVSELGTSSRGSVVDYIPFLDLYRVMSGLSWRTGMSLYIMSCTIYDLKGNLLEPGPVLDRVVAKLSDCVGRSLRSSDAACHCGGGRFLILLSDIVDDDCGIVQKRISGFFYEKGRSMRLEFDIMPVPEGGGA